MKYFFGVAAVAAMLMAGCSSHTSADKPEGNMTAKLVPPPPPAQPKLGWKPYRDETFETNPGKSKDFPVPVGTTKFKVMIEAESAVDGGLVNAALMQADTEKFMKMKPKEFVHLACPLISVDKAEAECVVDPAQGMTYMVRDTRAVRSKIIMLPGGYVKSSKIVEHGTMPDKIRVQLFTWSCVENCGDGAQ